MKEFLLKQKLDSSKEYCLKRTWIDEIILWQQVVTIVGGVGSDPWIGSRAVPISRFADYTDTAYSR